MQNPFDSSRHSELLRHDSTGAPVVPNCLVPIYSEYQNRPDPIGSGVVVRDSRGVIHLITAAHVLVKDNKPVTVCLFPGNDTTQYLIGQGQVFKEDICLFTPDLEVARHICRFVTEPLTLETLPLGRFTRSKSHFVAIGFAATKNRPDFQSRQINPTAHLLLTLEAAEASYDAAKIDSASKVALVFDRSNTLDLTNRPMVFPQPQGLSGGLMIQMQPSGTESSIPMQRPVAIITSWDPKHRLLIGTSLHHLARWMFSRGMISRGS